MKKQIIALLMAATVLLSGAAAFGGTYLANSLSDQAAPQYLHAGAAMGSAQPVVNLGTDIAVYVAASGASGASGASVSSAGSTGSSSTGKVLTIPEIASKASNSVVEIYTEKRTSGLLRQYVVSGSGSGVVVKSDGHIVTSDHVINGARKITVRLKNGTEYAAALVGRDSKNDLAVVKISASGLQAAAYGDSSKLVVGELAVAIGNPLGQLGGSVTEGIISALGRNIDIEGKVLTLLQTSAAVNPGNSGGGLFNKYGQLVGIVNSKSSGTDVEGIGFAVPVNTVKAAVKAIMG